MTSTAPTRTQTQLFPLDVYDKRDPDQAALIKLEECMEHLHRIRQALHHVEQAYWQLAPAGFVDEICQSRAHTIIAFDAVREDRNRRLTAVRNRLAS
jgi:hypothetical protein